MLDKIVSISFAKKFQLFMLTFSCCMPSDIDILS